jgi:hypothetical protein
MELLLWMWFYDTRWFFNFKISVNIYRYIWFIPMIINIFLSIFSGYSFFYFNEQENCDMSLKSWLFNRAILSSLVSFNILIFMSKIAKVNGKENSYFENAKKIYPAIEGSITDFDFWIRRKSLISTSGLILLFLGILNLFWSYLIINLYLIQNQFSGCNDRLLMVLNVNSIFIFIGNIPLLGLIIFLLSIKLFSFICAFLCPGFLKTVGRKFNKNMKLN